MACDENAVLGPAERISGMSRKRLLHLDEVELREIYNRLNECLNMYEEECWHAWGDSLRIKYIRAGKIILQMLRIADVMREKGICEDITSLYDEKDYHDLKIWETLMANRDILTPDRVKTLLMGDDEEAYRIFQDEIVPIFGHYRNYLKAKGDDIGIKARIVAEIEHTLNNIREGIRDTISENGSLVKFLRNFETSVKKVSEAELMRKQAEMLIKELEKDEERDLVNDMENTEDELDYVMHTLYSVAIGEKDVSQVENDLERFTKRVAELLRRWDNRYGELDRRKRELEEKEKELTEAIIHARDEERRIAEMEIEQLKKTMDIMSKKLKEYRHIRDTLLSEKRSLQYRLARIREKLEVSRSKGGIFVKSAEAKFMEEAFISLFEKRFAVDEGLPKTFRDVVNDFSIKVKDIEDVIHIRDSHERFLKGKTDIRRIPLNKVSRYIISKESFGRTKKIIVEARVISHPEIYVRYLAYDSPASVNDFLSVLQRDKERTSRGGFTKICGLASPTGWSEDAIDYVRSFEDRYLSICLIDLHDGGIYYNEGDRRMREYIRYFEAESEISRVIRCKDRIMEYIDRGEGGPHVTGVPIGVVKGWGYPEDIVVKAFKMLEDDGIGKVKKYGEETVFEKEVM